MEKSFIVKQALPDTMVALAEVGCVVILLGLGVVVAAIMTSRRKGLEVKGAAVVMIGPVPIAFGSDAKWVSIAMILAIILVVVTLLRYSV